MVGFKVPVCGAVDVFLKRPGAARAASCLVLRRVPIVGVNGVVGGVGLVNDLEFNIEIGGLTVEGVHARVGNGDVDVAGTFTHQTEESVRWCDFEVRHSEIFVVHLDHRERVVLAFPAKVVSPSVEVVVGVADHEVRCGTAAALELAHSNRRGTSPCWIRQGAHVAAVSIGKRHLDGGREVQEETGGAATRRVRGILLEGDGGVDEVGFAVPVEVGDHDGPRNVRPEVRQLRTAEGSLRGGAFVAHVLEVAVHHGNGVDVAVAADVCDGEVFGADNAHVDDVGVGLVRAVAVGCRVVLELAVVFDDGDVVVVTWVGGLARGVVQAFAAKQEDVVVGAGAGEAALGFAVVANFDHSIGVGLRRAKRGWYAVGGGGDWASVGDHALRGDVSEQVEHVDVIVSVLVCIADGHVPHPKVGKPLADVPVPVVATAVFDDGHVTWLASGCALVVGLEGVVLLVDDDVNGVVAGELAHFHLLNVRKLVPIRIAALVASHPDVLAFVEITVPVVVEDGH